MPRFHGVVVGALVGAAMLSGHAALADSRIFTARANAPGVVIEQAFRNGRQLAVVGHGDGTTLFRIDEPSTIVACANRFDFVTSTGEKVNLAADMCVLNWDVTVNVAQAPEGPPAEETAAPAPVEPPPAASAEAPGPSNLPPVPDVPEVPAAPNETTATPPPSAAPGASFSQVVTVSADDPAAIITSLTIDGEPTPVTGREGRAVQFEIQGTEQGIVCERDLGLTLGDGRTLVRKVNLCLNDWHVTVALADADTTVPSPPPSVAGPTEPALSEPTVGRAWSFNGGTLAATLVFGAPGTADAAFLAGCTRGSDIVTITLSEATVPGALPVLIGWTAGTGRLDIGGWILFLILFVWQLPHFMAIAWLCREDYAKAGLPMLTVVDPAGGLASLQTLVYCLALVPISLAPTLYGMTGLLYSFIALVLGVMYLVFGVRMSRERTTVRARQLLLASVVYLPLLYGAMMINR